MDRQRHANTFLPLRYGLADLAKLDAGYFGRGIYLTLNPEYACQYAAGYFATSPSNAPKPHPKFPKRHAVILCAVCVSMAYPVTPSEDYPNPDPKLSGFSKCLGQPLQPQFDAHFAPIHSGCGFQAISSKLAEYCELVVSQHAAVMPQIGRAHV